jgi:hypothetical protein
MYSKMFPLFGRIWKTAAISFPFAVLFLGLSMSFPWVFHLFFFTLGVAAGLMTYEKLDVRKVANLKTRGWQAFHCDRGTLPTICLQTSDA